MLEFQEKRKLKRYLYSKVTLVILLVIIIILLNAVWNMYQKQRLARENLVKTATIFNDLQAREKMLSSEIDRLRTVNGTEEEIREKYGLVKPGEEVLTVVGDNTGANSSSTTNQGNYWQTIVNWFQ